MCAKYGLVWQNSPTFSDAIALVRGSCGNIPFFNVPTGDRHDQHSTRIAGRFLKRYAMRRNWTKSSLEPSSSPHADQVPCAVLVRAEKRASPLNPWVGHRSLRARSAPL